MVSIEELVSLVMNGGNRFLFDGKRCFVKQVHIDVEHNYYVLILQGSDSELIIRESTNFPFINPKLEHS